MARIMFLDIEVENHPYYGAVASPRHPDNYVVLNGWACDENPFDGPIEYIKNTSKAEADSRPWLVIPEDVWAIVCHNASFELDWMLHTQRDELMRFLKRGGRILCTAYAHYLLTNQRETYPSLDEIAPVYGGTHKMDGIKALWEQGYLTSQIDPDLLLEYLVSPERGDIANTRTVFYGEYQQLVERGMWPMFLARCEAMVFNSFCMDSGLMIDAEVAERQRAEGEALLANLRTSFREHRKQYPELVEFKETSDFHMSAWLFGGPIKYRHRVPRFLNGKPVFVKTDAVHATRIGAVKYTTPIALPLDEQGMITLSVGGELKQFLPMDAAFQFDIEYVMYKSGKNKGLVKVERIDTTLQAEVWEDTLFQAPPLVDLMLLPETIREEFLKENTGKRKLADESPVISTGKDALEFLSKRSEFPEHVQKVLKDLDTFNKVDKDIGTYYIREERDDAGKVVKISGMLQYRTPIGIVHHMLNNTATATTRLSSNKPNFQNLPRGDTSDVKAMFVSRYDSKDWLQWAIIMGRIDREFFNECMDNIERGIPNGYIGELDYSALEVVTLAAFSQDSALIKALLENIDMHCMRLAKKLGEPYEDVLRKCKDDKHPDHARYSKMRTDIKPPSFAYQYGATAMGISYSTGMPLEEAEEFIRNEKELFPGVEAFYDRDVFPKVEASKVLHREQLEDGTWAVYGRGVWVAPGGTTYEFRQYPKTVTVYENGKRTRRIEMQFKPTQMRNYPIQGESGFFVQVITGLIMRWLVSKDFFGGRVHLINTVHDAVYVDVHRSVMDEVFEGIKAIMESLPTYISENFGYNLNVPFPAAAEFGVNMKQKVHWHKGVLDGDNHSS